MKRTIFSIAGLLFVVSCVKMDVSVPVEEPIVGPSYKFATNAPVIINELCPSNAGLISDESDNDPDWIELYNRSDSSVNLNGYGLSDDSSDIYKWKFGNVVIKPNEYLLVFASGNDVNEVKEIPEPDTITFLRAASWSDSMVGGYSSVRTNGYSTITPLNESGKKIISATINLVDNRPTLEWSSANITVDLRRKKVSLQYDYSMYNAVDFTMTLEKDKLLVIRFLQGTDVESWLSPKFVFRGTGVKNDVYTLPLIYGKNGMNLKNITGISIEAPQYVFTTTSFIMQGMRVYHTGYNIHTNYKLSGDDGKLFLSQADSVVLDTARIGSVPSDMSMGLCDSKWVLLKSPTPGLENVKDYYLSVSQVPQTVTKGGFYSAPVSVVLKSIDSSDIFYTLDGSVPTVKSNRYTGPVYIDSTSVLRYAGIHNGNLSSTVQTETYFINFTTKLPVVSIVADPGAYFDPDTGMYMAGPEASSVYPYFGANFWKDIEVPAYIQFFETDKKLCFSENVGTSVMGNWSRAEAKKSIGVKFNERFGSSELNYPIFPAYPNCNKFKKFVLRNNGGNFGKAMIEDPMMQSLMDDRNFDYQKYRPVVVFINGQYYGLHQMMEAANEDYLYTNYNLDDNQVDFYDVGAVVQGTAVHWNMLNDYLLAQVKTATVMTEVLSDTSYDRVKEYVDVYNYIDYIAFESFINNTDWPANNMRWWRNRTSGKWRWLAYDVDYGFGNYGETDEINSASHNMLAYLFADSLGTTDYPNGGGWTFLLHALMQNQTFKEDFVNRFATLVATNFASSRVKARIDSMYAEISDEVPRDSIRWNLHGTRKQYVDNMKAFVDARPAYIYTHIQSFFKTTGTYNLTVGATNGGVTINDMTVPMSGFKGTYFTGIPVRLTAVPLKGYQFKMWADGNTENPRKFDSDKDLSVQAVFE